MLAAASSWLAGCGIAFYDKPDLTYAEWKRDDAECRQAAQQDASVVASAYRRCLRERGYRVPDK